ncbi:hypothetical protein CDL15_Pgr003901 [Punica granatum]|uniref:Uncharacterized protein n=1 Tax=Punica granatum TaxID=22663 RepID=A0A218WQW1_PUNGR|nr:hypothetical protein CDL15_Pgr003901 [Punica granatum]
MPTSCNHPKPPVQANLSQLPVVPSLDNFCAIESSDAQATSPTLSSHPEASVFIIYYVAWLEVVEFKVE